MEVDEDLRMGELRRQKEKLEIAKLRAESGMLSSKEITLAVESMEWMYDDKCESLRLQEQEEYKLGKPIVEPTSSAVRDEGEPATGSLFLRSVTKTDSDTLRKIREDPLFAIQQAEIQHKKKLAAASVSLRCVGGSKKRSRTDERGKSDGKRVQKMSEMNSKEFEFDSKREHLKHERDRERGRGHSHRLYEGGSEARRRQIAGSTPKDKRSDSSGIPHERSLAFHDSGKTTRQRERERISEVSGRRSSRDTVRSPRYSKSWELEKHRRRGNSRRSSRSPRIGSTNSVSDSQKVPTCDPKIRRGAENPADRAEQSRNYEVLNLGPPPEMGNKLSLQSTNDDDTRKQSHSTRHSRLGINNEMSEFEVEKQRRLKYEEMLERGKKRESEKEIKLSKIEDDERRCELFETILHKMKKGGQKTGLEESLHAKAFEKASENLEKSLRSRKPAGRSRHLMAEDRID